MNELLSAKKIDAFGKVLEAYRKAGIGLSNAIDGGAGAGQTSKEILQHLESDCQVFAFEPFLGNHRFFSSQEKRIRLIPKALAEENKRMKFYVPSVVSEDSIWGQKGMAGYSSVGYLVEDGINKENALDVDCVTADSVISDKVGFVKLDLQGGELNALKGMTRILNDVLFMWVEYTGQQELISYLQDKGFMLFDTEYFFMGNATQELRQRFDVSRDNVALSTGKTACFGFKKHAWNSFETEFSQLRKDLNLVQTDIVCVNRKFLDEFLSAAAQL